MPKTRLITIIFMIIITSLYLVTRLVNILNLPIYVDEPLYVLRARETLDGDILFGLRESLKPVYVWIVAAFFLVIKDQLFVLRGVSVLAGLLTMPVCYLITKRLYPQQSLGYLAVFIYLSSPFALFFNRLGIVDTLLTLLMGLTILFSIYLWENPTIKWAVLLGLTLSLATLTKTYGILYGLTPILLWLLVEKRSSWRKFMMLMAVATSITILLAIIPIATVGAESFETESTRRAVYAAESEMNLLPLLGRNTEQTGEWLLAYLTWPILALFLLMSISLVISRDRQGWVLLLLIIELTLFFIIVSTDWHSRYLLPLIIPISVVCARGLGLLSAYLGQRFAATNRHKQIGLQMTLLLLLSIPTFRLNYFILTEPTQAAIPQRDMVRYVDGGFGLGYGLQQSAKFIQQWRDPYPTITLLTGPERSKWSIYMSLALPLDNVKVEEIGTLETLTPPWLDNQAQKAPFITLIAINTLVMDDDAPMVLEGSSLHSFHHPRLWRLAVYPPQPNPEWEWQVGVYQWLLPIEFAQHWFVQGGDANPQIAWYPIETQTPPHQADTLLDARSWSTVADLSQADYIFLTPDWVAQQPTLFAPYIQTDGTRLQLNQLPANWQLAYAYPDLNCEWCLFQLRPPQTQLTASFGNAVALEGVDLSTSHLKPEEALYVTLYWRSLEALSTSYKLFVQLLNDQGELVAQSDVIPMQGQWPTNLWNQGSRLTDRHRLLGQTLLPSGTYTIIVGVYDPTTLERIPVKAEGLKIDANAVTIGAVSVSP